MEMNLRALQSFFAEALSSFIFGFTIYSTVLNTKFETAPIQALSINLAVFFASTAVIYTFIDHTVAHFNPAITVAAMFTSKLDILSGIGYIISQLIGFILAALLAVLAFPGKYKDILDGIRIGGFEKDITKVNMFVAEFTLTAILVFVAFGVAINCARDPKVSLYGDEELPNRSILAPMVIGLTVGFLSFLAAKTSGGAFNPALIFAPMLLSDTWDYSWPFYVAEFLGGIFGAFVQVMLMFK